VSAGAKGEVSGSGATVLLLAGEASGDAHAAEVARELRRRRPDLGLVGVGGERMRAQGVELLAELDELAVMGFLEVLPRIPFFWRLERRLGRMLRDGEVDLVLPVDYPGFNLRMTRRAYRLGIPVLYYIAPQVWAWKARRAERLAREADRIAVILPFEEEIFEAHGGDVTFVGHPLVERPEDVAGLETFARSLGLDPERPVLALLPGSREQELDRHLELFREAAVGIEERRPGVQPVVGAASSVDPARLEATGYPVSEDSRALLRHARAAIVKSGTSTLEAALEATPFVMVYRTNPLTFALAKRLVRVDHVALANLVAGDRVVPELLQDEATAERLVEAVLPLLDPGAPERAAMVERLAVVRERLGEAGAAGRVASMALELLGPAAAAAEAIGGAGTDVSDSVDDATDGVAGPGPGGDR